jgi:starvation-inducible DNA-binding protein
MEINIGISNKNRSEVIKLLNGVLADAHVLYIKTRNFHWNVTGPNFSELHKFLEAQYKQLEAAIDEIAERVRALDGVSLGSMAEFLKEASLKENSGELLDSSKMIGKLLKDHEVVIGKLRKDVDLCEEQGDMGTSDFLTGLMQEHEKMAWMLRAHLQK